MTPRSPADRAPGELAGNWNDDCGVHTKTSTAPSHSSHGQLAPGSILWPGIAAHRPNPLGVRRASRVEGWHAAGTDRDV